MDISLDLKKRYTYADYLTWMDDKMRELWNGFIRMMSPAASTEHQRISRNISLELGNRIKKSKGKCEIFTAPFDVRLPKNGETADDKIYTVVQPDICVVCDSAKLDKKGCLGAPDMVIEILSPATMRYDLNQKLHIYEEAGVPEYWVVSPSDEPFIDVFILRADGKYDEGTHYQEKGKVPVRTFDGWEVDLKEIFIMKFRNAD